MNSIINSLKSMRFLEKLLIALTLISFLSKLIFAYQATIDLFLCSVFLSILYFPLGFYFLGKIPSQNVFFKSILLGGLYSISIVLFLLGNFSRDGFLLFQIFDILVLSIVLFVFFIKMRRAFNEYYMLQVLRSSFFIILNIIVLILNII